MVAQWILLHPLALGTDPCEEANLNGSLFICNFLVFTVLCDAAGGLLEIAHKCRNYVMMIKSV